MIRPIYTPDNVRHPAYQLNWSYSLFWKTPPDDCSWFEELQELAERDQIRILQHQLRAPNISQFLVSTRPSLKPLLVAQRVKGRLQHVLRSRLPQAFRRNYSLRSIGSTRRSVLEQYLAKQLGHHKMSDVRVQDQLKRYQIHMPSVDLSRPRRTAHAVFWCNLHIVIVNEGRYREICDQVLTRQSDMILRASMAKAHLLSRAAILTDHIHLALGCSLHESPEEVVLGYMNNLAYVCGMTPRFKFSYYVGTFSEYDLGVIPRG
jgi:hypothetical protein